MREARFYEKCADRVVLCRLCRHGCRIVAGGRGICAVRENRDGTLYTHSYGHVVAEHVDPVEKKPLFHFQPGSRSYSLATPGCNFRCLHCQNYSISQCAGELLRHELPELPPERVVERAMAAGCSSISYTYTEPTIFFEYAFDIAVLAHEQGLKNIFVTNGYITDEALAAIAPYLDGANIDLKGFTEQFYHEVVGARLAEVLATIRSYRRLGIWLEITTLLIPGLNDDAAQLQELTSFIVRELGIDTPWHVSRFFPTYRLLDRPPTPVSTLHRAREIGRQAGLRYVYEGNTPGGEGENTRCPACSELIIERHGFAVASNRLTDGHCPTCRGGIAGVDMGHGAP